MAFAHVQSKGSFSPSITQLSITVTAAGLNNLVVVTFWISTGATVTSVTDNASTPNTYAQAAMISQAPTTGFDTYQYYGVQTTSGATHILINTDTAHDIRAAVDEFSGGKTTNSSVYDKSSTGSNNSTQVQSASVTSFTPTNDGELIAAGIALQTQPGATTAGSNYTVGLDAATGGGSNNISTEYRLSSSGAETAPVTWTNNSKWGEIASAFKVFIDTYTVSVSDTATTSESISVVDYSLVASDTAATAENTKVEANNFVVVSDAVACSDGINVSAPESLRLIAVSDSIAASAAALLDTSLGVIVSPPYQMINGPEIKIV